MADKPKPPLQCIPQPYHACLWQTSEEAKVALFTETFSLSCLQYGWTGLGALC